MADTIGFGQGRRRDDAAFPAVIDTIPLPQAHRTLAKRPSWPRNRAKRVLAAWKRWQKTRTAWNWPSTICWPTCGQRAARFGFSRWISPPGGCTGQRIADAVATVMGSWTFIIVQSAILFVWIAVNLVGRMRSWDPYPFILLNLALSFQAAYAAPVIMMSQNRQQDIDRKAAENDYRINVKAELEIELLHGKVDRLREREVLKLTEAVTMLTELLKQSGSGACESEAEAGQAS